MIRPASSPADRERFALDVIAENERILRDPLLTGRERRAYQQATTNARARLAEARAELLLAPPVGPTVEIPVEVTDDPFEPRAELPWKALVKARGRLEAA